MGTTQCECMESWPYFKGCGGSTAIFRLFWALYEASIKINHDNKDLVFYHCGALDAAYD